MNLNMLQTELVACALCEADGKNPADTVSDEVSDAPGQHERPRPLVRKAWHSYEDEARRLVLATETMARFSRTLGMFQELARFAEDAARA